jgi:prephenate dehydrogenase
MTYLSLENAHVAIIGLGLMGGSMALALHGRCRRIGGFDIDDDTLKVVKNQNIVDHVFSGVGEIIEEAQVIILAVPVAEIIRILRSMPSSSRSEIIIIDLGSTKVDICKALEKLPEGFSAIGGHPMCGKETLGIRQATPELYVNASFALTPITNTTQVARLIAGQIVESIGAHPVWLDPETHDRWVAVTSHLPYVIALALTLATPAEVSPMIGTGFRSTARLSATPSSMMHGVLKTNRHNLLEALERFKIQLNSLEEVLEDDKEIELLNLLELGAASYQTLLSPRWRLS